PLRGFRPTRSSRGAVRELADEAAPARSKALDETLRPCIVILAQAVMQWLSRGTVRSLRLKPLPRIQFAAVATIARSIATQNSHSTRVAQAAHLAGFLARRGAA